MGTLSTPAPGIRTVLMSNSWFAGLPEVVRDNVVARARGRTLAPGEQIFSRSNPLSLLDTDIGAESVMDTLGRIEHGVFA